MSESSSATTRKTEIITKEKTIEEIYEIMDDLDLQNLYRLLGCARGILNSQKVTRK